MKFGAPQVPAGEAIASQEYPNARIEGGRTILAAGGGSPGRRAGLVPTFAMMAMPIVMVLASWSGAFQRL